MLMPLAPPPPRALTSSTTSRPTTPSPPPTAGTPTPMPRRSSTSSVPTPRRHFTSGGLPDASALQHRLGLGDLGDELAVGATDLALHHDRGPADVQRAGRRRHGAVP